MFPKAGSRSLRLATWITSDLLFSETPHHLVSDRSELIAYWISRSGIRFQPKVDSKSDSISALEAEYA
jgi:hypothetical protein